MPVKEPSSATDGHQKAQKTLISTLAATTSQRGRKMAFSSLPPARSPERISKWQDLISVWNSESLGSAVVHFPTVPTRRNRNRGGERQSTQATEWEDHPKQAHLCLESGPHLKGETIPNVGASNQMRIEKACMHEQSGSRSLGLHHEVGSVMSRNMSSKKAQEKVLIMLAFQAKHKTQKPQEKRWTYLTKEKT